jgi:hypothetical protein
MARNPRASCKNAKPPEYAPAVFARTPEAIAAGITKADFEAAMHQLLAAGKIKSVPYGRYSRLVRVKK